MGNKLRRKIRDLIFKKDYAINSKILNNDKTRDKDNHYFINSDYTERINILKKYFKNSADFVLEEFTIGNAKAVKWCIGYIRTIADEGGIKERVINQLIHIFNREDSNNYIMNKLSSKDIFSVEFNEMNCLNDTMDYILNGGTVLLCSDFNNVFCVPTEDEIEYKIIDSQKEISIRGPRTAFTNDLDTKIRFIRNFIKTSRLKVRTLKIGKYSKSEVSIVYIEDIASNKIVNRVFKDIKSIDIDGIINVSNILELIEKNSFSMFPIALSTERVDRVVGNLLEGRIALLVNGSPDAAILPVTISAFFQTSEDYYIRPVLVFFLRFLRYSAFLIASTATPLYIAISIYHYEIIPFKLLIPFAEAIAPIPFPPAFEALLLEIFAEILGESSNRASGSMGPLIGILGAVLVGQAAIQANLASPALVITVAIGVVSSFVIPNNELVLVARNLKFILLVFAAIF